MEETVRVNQNIIIENRKKLTLTGIKDVVSFDEETVNLDSVLGRLTIKGSGLHIISFNTETGDMTVEGKVYAAAYISDEKNGGGIMSRIFR